MRSCSTRGPTRISGRRPMIAIWPMSSPSKARSPRPLPTSCRRSSRLTRRKRSSSRPTTDLAAFDLYSRAKSLLLTTNFSITGEPDVRKAIELLDEAVKHDPSFFDAYYQLAYAHGYLYGVRGYDHTPARLALAEAAVQAATRLRPDAAETHLARAQYLYNGRRDYAGALAEL